MFEGLKFMQLLEIGCNMRLETAEQKRPDRRDRVKAIFWGDLLVEKASGDLYKKKAKK